MSAKKRSAASTASRPAGNSDSSASHSLDVLLHTMRCIAQYEDTLCELSHEWRRTGSLSPESSDELVEILDNIPSQDYVMDLDSVKEMLEESRTRVSVKARKKQKGDAAAGKS